MMKETEGKGRNIMENNKKKQTAAVVMATALSVSAIMSPNYLHAQDADPLTADSITDGDTGEEKNVKETDRQEGHGDTAVKAAPEIIVPTGLKAQEKDLLADIKLPKDWTWADDTMPVLAESSSYPARYKVDDSTYDYHEVEGYDAEGHYVKRDLQVMVIEPEEEKPVLLAAASDIIINTDNFPDEKFRNYITETIDTSKDGALSEAEIGAVISINVNNREINDLKGIEFFTALETLDCGSNFFNTLDLSKNTALKDLSCSFTNMTSLDLRSNTKLETLNAEYSALANIDLGENKVLKQLVVTEANLMNLDFLTDQPLTTLDCSSNKLSQIDVSKFDKLEILKVTGNVSVTDLDIRHNPLLKELDCSNTGLTSLDTSQNSKLTKLECSNTSISTLDVHANIDLQELSLSKTQVTGLDVTRNKNLTSLDSQNTAMTWLNIGNRTNLSARTSNTTKSIDAGPSFDITEKYPGIDVNRIKNLKGAVLHGNIISGYEKGTPITYTYHCGTLKDGSKAAFNVTLHLSELAVNEQNFPDPYFREMITNDVDSDRNGTLSDAEIEAVTEFDTEGSLIQNMKGIEYFTNFSWGWLCYSNITELDFTHNPALESLNLAELDLKYLDLSKNTELTDLQIGTKNLKRIDLSHNKKLEDFYIQVFGPDGVDVSENTALKSFYIMRGSQAWVNIGNNPQLDANIGDSDVINVQAGQQFDITKRFPGIDVNRIKNLTGAVRKGNIISSYTIGTPFTYIYECGTGKDGPVEYKVTMNVSEIVIDENNFPDPLFRQYVKDNIDTDGDGFLSDAESDNVIELLDSQLPAGITTLQGCEYFNSLMKVTYSGRSLKDIDISQNTQLNEISLHNTSIQSIDVSKNEGIQKIDISDSPLQRIDIRNNLDLENLMLKNTEVTSVDASQNSSLQNITVAGSPILWMHYPDEANADFTTDKTNTDLLVKGQTFDITKEIPGIDPTRLRDITGGSLDGNIITIDNLDSFSYTYDCGGTISGTADSMQQSVTLRLDVTKGDSSITIIDVPEDSVYTGTALSVEPSFSHSGSTKEVSYVWEKKDGTSWNTLSGSPKDAGTYRIKASVEEDTYYEGTTSTSSEFTISKAANDWKDGETLFIDQWTYSTTPSVPRAEALFGEPLFTYSDAADGVFTETIPVNAGTWYIKAEIAGTDNYDGLRDVYEFNILKAASTLKIKDTLNAPYTGKEVNLEVERSGSGAALKIVWLKWDGSRFGIFRETPSQAGRYQARVNLPADENHEGSTILTYEFTITQAVNAWKVPLSISDWTFNGEAQTPSAVADFGTVTYSYSSEENGAYTETVPSQSGTWYVKAEVSGTSNYSSLEAKKQFTIEKADSSIVINEDVSSVYTGEAVKEPACTKTGTSNEIAYTWEKQQEDGTWSVISEAPKDCGTYRVKASASADANYKKAVSEYRTFTISQAANTWKTPLSISDWTYGKTPVQPSASSAYGTVTYTYSNLADGVFTETVPNNAGTYFVKASVAGTENYTALTATASFEIKKADSSITIDTVMDQTYTGKTVTEFETTRAGSSGNVNFTWKKQSGSDWIVLDEAPAGAGVYQVTAHLDGDDNHNGADSSTLTFTITKAVNEWKSTPSISGWVYGEKAAEPAGSGAFGTIRYTYSSEEHGTYTEVKPEHAGTWYMKADITETNDYSGLSMTTTFTIAKAESSIVITESIGRAYTGEAVKEPTVTRTGSDEAISFVWEEHKNDTWSVLSQAPINAGVYRVKAQTAGNTDYKETVSAYSEFEITQALNTWTSELSITGWTYGDTANAPQSSADFGTIVYTYSDEKNGTYTETIPADAGTWYVKAAIEETSNYTGLTTSPETFVIEKAASTITMTGPTNSVYTGTAVADPAVSVTGSANTPSLQWEKKAVDGTWSKLDSAPVHAGDYRVTAHVAADKNYKAQDSSTNAFTITQAVNSWSSELNMNDWSYGDKAESPVSASTFGKVFYQYGKTVDGEFSDEKPSNAGTWYVKAEVSETPDYSGLREIRSFEIKQAVNDWKTALDIKDWTYGEKAEIPSAEARFGMDTICYTYSNSRTGVYTEDVPSLAGTWYVKGTISETANYTGISDVIEFTIKKAAAPKIVLPQNLSTIHNKPLSSITLPTGWSWKDESENVSVDKSSYTARLEVDDENYDYSSVSGYDSIHHFVERELDVTVAEHQNEWIHEPEIKNWTFNEQPSQPAAQSAYGNVVYTYSSSEDGVFADAVPVNAGTWYMKAEVKKSNAYTGLEKIVKFEISKAIPSYKVPEQLRIAYGGVLKDISLPAHFSWAKDTILPAQTGTYTLMLDYIPEDRNNYESVHNIEVRVTVEKAENNFITELSAAGWIYGDKAAEPLVKAKFGTPYYIYSREQDGEYTDVVPVEAGTWYVKAAVIGTDNYEALESAPISFVIKPKDITGDASAIPDIDEHTDLNAMEIHDGDIILKQGVDYDISITKINNTVSIVIGFKGNYKGYVLRSYAASNKEINPEDGTLTSENENAVHNEEIPVSSVHNAQIFNPSDNDKKSEEKEEVKDNISEDEAKKQNSGGNHDTGNDNGMKTGLIASAVTVVGGAVAIITGRFYKKHKKK